MKIEFKKPENIAGNSWGALAAMLVALPSAIAFGVTIYAPLGSEYIAYGALAGILGAMFMGLIAPVFGGTNRLISAPCAPAAAVLSAFVIDYMSKGGDATIAVMMVALLGLMTGLLQVGFGVARLGQLIKYMPYTVVSGYLSGVGLYIIASQMPKFLGTPKGTHFWEALGLYNAWQWEGIAVGVVTALIMTFAAKFTKLIPAAILALVGGVASYFALSLFDPALLSIANNPLIIGPLGGGGFLEAVGQKVEGIKHFDISNLALLITPALTLAALLSIDTLKTCVVLDAMTRSRHDSNKELIGQGLANIGCAFGGGVPGAGTMGATLVNISSGATTRLSGFLEGVLSLIAFLILAPLISWVPISALAAILIVIGVKMIDTHSFSFLRSRSTILDFAVIAAVVTTALTVSLIAASGVGVALAILLFIREHISTSIVRRKSLGNESFSKQIRVQEEMDILLSHGNNAAIYELQGSLFFGTANQLLSILENDIKTKKFITLDMKKVQGIDITAMHILEQVRDMMEEKGGFLLFSSIPLQIPSGLNMQQYFEEIGIAKGHPNVKIFSELDDAIEWVEDRIIEEASLEGCEQVAMPLYEFELFKGKKEETIANLEERMQKLSFNAGERIFAAGDTGDELFLIRRGNVRIVLPICETQSYHISTFGQGNFFGEMAFLDGAVRSADAVCESNTELYALSRAEFDKFAEEHKKISLRFMEGIASVLAGRLRFTNAELRACEA
jgi:sulfate permease, SulP family